MISAINSWLLQSQIIIQDSWAYRIQNPVYLIWLKLKIRWIR